MTAEVWLTVGLLFSALSQAGFQWWGSEIASRAADDEADRRLKERNAEAVVRRRAAEDDQDAAFFQVWSESFRIESLADQWDEQDLIELSIAGVLNPDAVKSVGSGELVRAAVRISHPAGYLAAVAVTLANDLASQMEMFNSSVAEAGITVMRPFASLTSVEKLSKVRTTFGAQLNPRAVSLRRGVRELALLLNDVSMQTARVRINRSVKFSDDLRSEAGRQAAEALVRRAAAIMPGDQGQLGQSDITSTKKGEAT